MDNINVLLYDGAVSISTGSPCPVYVLSCFILFADVSYKYTYIAAYFLCVSASLCVCDRGGIAYRFCFKKKFLVVTNACYPV